MNLTIFIERKLEAAVGPRPPSQNAQAQSSARARRRGSNASVTSSVRAAPVKPPRAGNAASSTENDELILGALQSHVYRTDMIST